MLASSLHFSLNISTSEILITNSNLLLISALFNLLIFGIIGFIDWRVVSEYYGVVSYHSNSSCHGYEAFMQSFFKAGTGPRMKKAILWTEGDHK